MARMRVVIDNDFSGDPDGLLQLVHHLLSPSVEIRAVIGSAVPTGDPFDPTGRSADHARDRIVEVLTMMGLGDRVRALAGSNLPLPSRTSPQVSDGGEALIAEAMRTDTDLPLYAVFGASLTQLASAYLFEPAIADRLTAVWIGGPEYPGTAAPPGTSGPEYNLRIDITAAQVVFNDSPISLWQVPRDAYRQALVSWAELEARVRPAGPLGAYLYRALDRVRQRAATHGMDIGETYIAGDSPLVLLTALQSSFEPEPSSSRFETRPAPTIENDGAYTLGSSGRPIRVYTHLDVRLMLEDLYAKLAAAGSASTPR
jgi:Inosine-uridine preferring nucleoside hydrolase